MSQTIPLLDKQLKEWAAVVADLAALSADCLKRQEVALNAGLGS